MLFLGTDDAAVGLLVTHFQAIIPSIVAGTWKHYIIGLSKKDLEKLTGIKPVRKKRKRAKESKEAKADDKEEERNSPDYKWTISALKPDKLTFDPNPHSFFTCSSHFLCFMMKFC